jgi:hypothetical protein
MLVPIPEAARGGTRLRLRTNLEVYWDWLAVAEERPATVLRTQHLEAERAELRYRGFSRTSQDAAAHAPEEPDYARIANVTPRWRDLVGYHTRFGDVRELLASTDDRYAILNAGDELSLRFPAPPAPPAGWRRDFIVISDGWVKDGDFNTTASRTVLPLPTHASPSYDRRPGSLEDDPVFQRHREDFERYHTRYVSPDAFRDALRPPNR